MQTIRRNFIFILAVSALMLLGHDIDGTYAQSESSEAIPRLQLARGEDGKVTLAFTPIEGAKAYAIKMVADDGVSEVIQNVEVSDYTVHGLANGRDYRFSVCAMTDGRQGPWSNEFSARPVAEPSWETLREAFTSSNPTRNSNPFVMIHGKESETELREIMRVAYDAGFEGVTLHPYTYEDYLGPGQWDRWKIIFDQARRLGLIVWQQDDYNYPSGFAMGKVVEAHPEFGRTELVEAANHALDGPQKGFSLDIQSLLQGRDFLVAISAFPENGEPIDLTDRVVDGKLTWDVPDGKWQLFVTKAVWCGPMYVAESEPMPFIDFMNPKAVDAYIEAIYQASFDHFGAEFGRTFKGFFSDEAPVDFAQFTPDFLERFEQAKGYSIRKWLPSVMHDLSSLDKKIRTDYRDFIREQNATVFFGRSRQWCRDHGVQLIGHVIEHAHQQDMRRLECLDFPGVDNVFGQWYDPEQDVYWRASRMTSSVAHYAGSHNDIALVEHFAATGWRTGLSEMKRMMDWSTVMGLNQIVPCGLDTQSPPCWQVTPDFWLHGKNPQWPYFSEYQAAANRMTMMMRGGRHVAPAIVLDTTESEWVQRGADRSSIKEWSSPPDDLWQSCAAMSQAQVDFDLIPYYVFADSARTAFDKDRVRIAKEDYRAVIVPDVEFIPAAVAERLREFYETGGTVVAINRVPSASCNGEEDEQVRAAVEAIWGDKASKRGKSAITNLEGLQACLIGLEVPDVRVSPPAKSLLYCHRQLHGKDLYFFANTGADPISPTIELRGVSGVPTIWDPVDGKITEVPNYSAQDDVLKLTLPFGEYESRFVVIEPNGDPRQTPSQVLAEPQSIVVAGPWQVSNGSDDFHRLFTTEVSLPNDWPVGSPARLELQGASQILRVKVNGKPAGERFCSPYRFEVGEYLSAGSNRIEIERIGRYSSPDVSPIVKKISITDDATVNAPCRQTVTLTRQN